MKYNPFLYLSVLFCISCTSLKSEKNPSQELLYDFQIRQNDKIVEYQTEGYLLRKEPFQIELTLLKEQPVFINFSQNDALYQAVKNGENFEEILWFGGTGMAEYPENEKKRIYLSDSGWHYWLIRESGSSRFNRIIDNSSNFTVIREIENIFSVMEERNVPFYEIDRIYCVICDVTTWEKYNFRLNEAKAFVIEFISPEDQTQK